MNPGFPAVYGLINSVAVLAIDTNASLAGPHVDDVRVGLGDGYRADGSHVLFIEDGLPNHAAVRRLPKSSPGRSEVIDLGISRNPGDAENPAASIGSYQSPSQRL